MSSAAAAASVPVTGSLFAPGRANGEVLRVGIVYILAGLGGFLLMGLLGLVMRLDQSGMAVISPVWFYRIMTLHGAGMVASILLASYGGIAAAVSTTTPLDPRALWIALFVYLAGMMMAIMATLIGGVLPLLGDSYQLPRALRSDLARVAYLMVGMTQSALLGALIAFHRTVLYSGYLQAPGASAASALADQRLAGMLMWLPGMVAFMLFAALVIGRRAPEAARGA